MARLEELLVLLHPSQHVIPHMGRHPQHKLCVPQKVQIFPDRSLIFRFCGDPFMCGTLQVVNSKNLVDMLAHQVVHDHDRYLLHILDLDIIDSVEAGKHGVFVVTNVVIVLVEDPPLDEETQLRLLQGLDDELAVGCVEKEAVGFARADLELCHLYVVFTRSESTICQVI